MSSGKYLIDEARGYNLKFRTPSQSGTLLFRTKYNADKIFPVLKQVILIFFNEMKILVLKHIL